MRLLELGLQVLLTKVSIVQLHCMSQRVVSMKGSTSKRQP